MKYGQNSDLSQTEGQLESKRQGVRMAQLAAPGAPVGATAAAGVAGFPA